MGRLMVFRRGLSFVLTSAWANSQAHQLILNPQLDMKAFGPLWSPQENPGSFGLRLHLKPKTPNFQVKTQYVCTLHIPKTERQKKGGEGIQNLRSCILGPLVFHGSTSAFSLEKTQNKFQWLGLYLVLALLKYDRYPQDLNPFPENGLSLREREREREK